MKPYGNEHTWAVDNLNSTKHRPRWRSALRRGWRRVMKKTTRAKAKTTLRHATDD